MKPSGKAFTVLAVVFAAALGGPRAALSWYCHDSRYTSPISAGCCVSDTDCAVPDETCVAATGACAVMGLYPGDYYYYGPCSSISDCPSEPGIMCWTVGHCQGGPLEGEFCSVSGFEPKVCANEPGHFCNVDSDCGSFCVNVGYCENGYSFPSAPPCFVSVTNPSAKAGRCSVTTAQYCRVGQADCPLNESCVPLKYCRETCYECLADGDCPGGPTDTCTGTEQCCGQTCVLDLSTSLSMCGEEGSCVPCPNPPIYTPPVSAAVYGEKSKERSGVLNHLAYFLIPAGMALLLLRILRNQKKE